MAFYSKNKQGKSISSQEVTSFIDVPNQDAFVGFIPRATLELLLEPDSSVGIRLYNAFTFNNDTDKIMAVGVTEEGDEIEEPKDGELGYIICSMELNDNNGMNVSNITTRNISRDSAKRAASGIRNRARLSFASYFSAEDIKDLLDTPGCNGIIIHAIKTKLPSDPSQNTHNSHLAIAAQHTVDPNGKERLALIDKQMISLNPCPPNCAPETTTRATTTGNTTNLQTTTTQSVKYLISWM